MKTVHLIAACRPNFMKVAPLYHALAATDWCRPVVVNVRQHTDANMSDDFLKIFELESVRIPMGQYAGACASIRPDAVVVVGDVNATADCAVAAARLNIPVIHLEAGLRSFDRSMPEEINRIVADSVSGLLLTPDSFADDNLAAGGRYKGVHRVGNIMMDALEMVRPRVFPRIGAPYAVATFHRPSNVDTEARLRAIIANLNKAARHMEVVLVAHPRLEKRIAKFDLDCLELRVVPPMDYIDFLGLVTEAKIVVTDSGGLQEETSYLGIPCATVRENTERPITITMGTNHLITPGDIPAAVETALAGKWNKGKPIPLWDGKTAPRCVGAIKHFMGVE